MRLESQWIWIDELRALSVNYPASWKHHLGLQRSQEPLVFLIPQSWCLCHSHRSSRAPPLARLSGDRHPGWRTWGGRDARSVARGQWWCLVEPVLPSGSGKQTGSLRRQGSQLYHLSIWPSLNLPSPPAHSHLIQASSQVDLIIVPPHQGPPSRPPPSALPAPSLRPPPGGHRGSSCSHSAAGGANAAPHGPRGRPGGHAAAGGRHSTDGRSSCSPRPPDPGAARPQSAVHTDYRSPSLGTLPEVIRGDS